jgi:hypothetical protein
VAGAQKQRQNDRAHDGDYNRSKAAGPVREKSKHLYTSVADESPGTSPPVVRKALFAQLTKTKSSSTTAFASRFRKTCAHREAQTRLFLNVKF